MKTLAMFLLLTLASLPMLAQPEDAEGCKDSVLLSRIRGCNIFECSVKDFDAAELLIGYDLAHDNAEKHKSVEGAVEVISYECSASVSNLAVARNAETALKQAGYTVVFSGKNPHNDDRPLLTARKGGVWVSVVTGFNGSTNIYTVTTARSQEMEQQMVADAAAMEAEITSSGYCSIYGVLFDSGKATIQPGSSKCLDEVAALLKKNAGWKMQIEGHTDNVGGKEANAKLSQARADAVRGWLVSHGIAAARLTAKGFGDSKPKVENTTEDGRSKNRRVDLRKL